MAGVRAEEFAGPVNGDRHPWDDEAEVVIKGDHKKQFSAERTTNQWVLLGIKSGGIAIGMLAAGRYSPPIKIAGLLLMFPAIFCAAWGGIQYRRRTSKPPRWSERHPATSGARCEGRAVARPTPRPTRTRVHPCTLRQRTWLVRALQPAAPRHGERHTLRQH